MFYQSIRFRINSIVLSTNYLLFSDNTTSIKYGSTDWPGSSVTILAGSLTPNQTYQFVVYMVNRKNSSFQATGYVIVKVEDTEPQLVAIA